MGIQLYTPETRYAVASIPLAQYREVLDVAREAEGFVSVTRDKEEVTFIVAQTYWQQLASRFPQAAAELDRRMIRFDTVLDFSVVGFIAEISRALAEAGISILSISTYRTDAVLVHASQFEAAVGAVKRALITLSFTHLSQL
jgi:uncharacterized protein